MNEASTEPQAASFIDKWLAAEPEMAIGMALIPAPEKPLAALWGALLNEIAEAALTLSDTGVAQAKLAWWGGALAGASDEAAHPLLRALFALPEVAAIPSQEWTHLANAAIELASLEDSPSSIEAVLSVRLPLAEAITRLETQLWPSHRPDPNSIAIALLLRQWRAGVDGDTPRPGFVPLQLLARHDLRMHSLHKEPQSAPVVALFADLAQAVRAAQGGVSGARLRRIRAAFDARLLERLAHARHGKNRDARFALPRLKTLWWAWRAASSLPYA